MESHRPNDVSPLIAIAALCLIYAFGWWQWGK